MALFIVCERGGRFAPLFFWGTPLDVLESGETILDENTFDLHRMLDDLEDMPRLRADLKGLSLLIEHAPDAPRHVGADETKLRQVLINLIGNAIKFILMGGDIRLSGEAGKGATFLIDTRVHTVPWIHCSKGE